MAFAQKAMFMFFLVMAAALEVSLGAVYKVGDAKGWTTLGKINYTAWAASKNFHVGDTIHFEYSKQFHNVMQVTHSDFQACNVSSPMLTYATGNDSVVIKKTGHYYFLCGVPGHCQLGQKVDIRVPKSSVATAPSPYGSASSPIASTTSSPSGAVAGAPGPSQKSSAPYPSSNGFVGKLGMALLALAVSVCVLDY
ncbi:mavicyanin-like [Telopea speciosissima]|uniref:mavicyanin-like n=1 Tax=Telopea speciosissima TaxID=54955 RepID=UPI001CC5F115|nr:mavicyanin-like [Telopea speciosissima]